MIEKIILTESDDVVSAIKKIKDSKQTSLEIFIPEKGSISGNLLNLKILKKEAVKLNKKIVFEGEMLKEKTQLSAEFVEGDILDHYEPEEQDFDKRRVKTSRAKDLISDLKNKINNILKGRKKLAAAFAGILAALVIAALFLVIWFLPSANLSLVVNSEVLVKSVGIVLTPSYAQPEKEDQAQLEESKAGNVLSSILIEVNETKIQGTKATGKKKVGEKASGKVTVKNWTDIEKQLSKGETITSVERVDGERLNYFLNSDALVPAKTATISATPETRTTIDKPGAAEVEVAAENVGESYNLSEGKLFTLGGESLDFFEVVSETVLSGGSSREVTVVTNEDREKLSKALNEVLKEKAKGDLESKLVVDQKLHGGTVKYDVVGEKYSREIGDEADDFSLTLEIKAQALVYSEAKLNELLENVLKDFVPEGFEISDRDREMKVDVLRALGEPSSEPNPTDAQTAEIQVKIRSYVLPEIDPDKISRGLVGLRLSFAQEYLTNIPNIESYQIQLWPPLPSFLRTMPRSKGRINIEVVRK